MTRSVLALIAVAVSWGADETRPPLLSIRRVHVEKLTGESADQIRDMLINALQASKVFVLTEAPEKADAILRGSAEDLIYTENFQSGEQVSARASIGSSGTASRTSGRRLPGVSVGVGLDESTRSNERKHEATAAVRLVNRDGDVVWATTQESTGAKFRGASADVADKVVRQLLADMERSRHPEPTPAIADKPAADNQ